MAVSSAQVMWRTTVSQQALPASVIRTILFRLSSGASATVT